MKNTFTIILLLCIFNQNAFSQSQETGAYVFINGRLRLDTDAPASFAHIYIKHKNMGGISDVNGEFSFNLPSFYSGDTLVATYVGYNPVEIPISDLIGEEVKSYVLLTKVIELDEVIIYAPHKVLKEAISSLPPVAQGNNYHVKKGLITLTRQEDENITLLEEIAFDLYYRGEVENPYGYDPTQHRRSVDHSRFPYIYTNQQKSFGLTWFFGIYTDQYVRKFLSEPDSLDLNISDLAVINEERHLVISHKTKGRRGDALLC